MKRRRAHSLMVEAQTCCCEHRFPWQPPPPRLRLSIELQLVKPHKSSVVVLLLQRDFQGSVYYIQLCTIEGPPQIRAPITYIQLRQVFTTLVIQIASNFSKDLWSVLYIQFYADSACYSCYIGWGWFIQYDLVHWPTSVNEGKK